MTRPSRRRPASAVALLGAAVAGLVVLACSAGCTGVIPMPSAEPSHRADASPTPSTPPIPTPTASTGPPAGRSAGSQAPFHLEVGQCVDVRKDRRTGPESIVPCDVEHDDEAFDTFALDGGAYPGEVELETTATDGCRARFGGFIGVPYSESVYETYAVFPTAATWASGDRKVTCVVWYPADSVVGSLAGAGS
ncbi:septum formation family protein [Agromyces aureus]|uniref:Septum formation-related domain-containing protein n=1 Tax=Agromyces aureus TaxID=453304 RepID=A0A191WJV4_9MICO|nr:septum formation family protein [Agromyces aureus]ANJ28459.1 hypothetical protein ATC03_18940 [Agromyces aureus]